MRLRADFDRAEVVRPEDYVWVASPVGGVERMMLDRIGGEVARATSLVRFAPDSRFDPHTHDGGEEYLVLQGVFSDETGDFPAGSYVRNPIGTRHQPHTAPGCTILVKLWQFDADDTQSVHIDTNAAVFVPGSGTGVTQAVLHRHGPELVRLVRFAPGAVGAPHIHAEGEEVFVVEGSYADENGSYAKGTWVRAPAGSSHAPVSETGCLLWIKTGHLAA